MKEGTRIKKKEMKKWKGLILYSIIERFSYWV